MLVLVIWQTVQCIHCTMCSWLEWQSCPYSWPTVAMLVNKVSSIKQLSLMGEHHSCISNLRSHTNVDEAQVLQVVLCGLIYSYVIN